MAQFKLSNVVASVLFAASVSAAELDNLVLRPSVSPFDIADAVIVMTPHDDVLTARPETYAREITGQITSVSGTLYDLPIVHPPGVIIDSLTSGQPVKLLLKRSLDGKSYYVIGVFEP